MNICRAPSIDHGIWGQAWARHGETIDFSCETNFTAAASSASCVCVANGTLCDVGTALSCLANLCTVPSAPSMGTYDASLTFVTHGDLLDVTCLAGYAPVPAVPAECYCPISGRTCVMSDTVTCEAIVCYVPPLENGYYNVDEAAHAMAISASCNSGFFRVGASTDIC
eukprot:COSAG06_NODE_27197_length_598_cov_1.136273_2_plen_167_part_01